MQAAVGWMAAQPYAGPVLALTAALCTVSQVITTAPLNIAAGVICGSFLAGCFWFSFGAIGGSVINFYLGRKMFRAWALRQLAASPTLSALEAAIAERAASMIVLARLSPVFPFAMAGFALGATQVDAWTFTWATAVGLIPGIVLYTWIGLSVQAAAAGGEGGSSWTSYISIAAGIISTALISVLAKQVWDQATSKVHKAKDYLLLTPELPRWGSSQAKDCPLLTT